MRMGHVGHDWGQKTPENDFTYIDVGSINKELGAISEPGVIRPKDAPSRARKIVRRNTVLYSTVRPYLLNIAIVDEDYDPEPIASTAFAIIHPWKGISSTFIYHYLRSPIFVSYVESCQTGIAYPAINDKQFFTGVIAIPPAEEQLRIVSKVNKLMSLCDQLEQQSLTSLDAHKKLVETLLATLTDSQNAKELSENWSRISQHFDTLFTTEASIDTLKQTILQLAVMGKLVPQDPNNEPASELVRRIEQEKAQMVKDGKIKKQKPLPPISDEEKPFELPMGWEWCRLGTLFNFQNGYAFKSEWFSDNGIRLVRNANISHGHINWADSVKLPDSRLSEFEGFSLNVGDIVISLDRPIINTGLKYAFIRECDLPCLLLQRVAKFSSIGNMILSGFLSKWLESNYFINAIDPGRSNGVPHISTKQLEMTLFPLLSQNEQDKIISKANELIQVCEHLKSRLQSAQQTQLHLADALTEAVLS
ncbi:restriction endonuclease subunit S [Providencia rettgeri]|uniref:Restriction endonuclease subunit S n=2 Tax=Morganellaceae TaxID=1903414 RepID=A0AAJ6JXA4_PRORE|nr:restriction endonuclease subunit S [Providencia rettgeri]WHT81581.1 restriction endonuclease subunit S [Providencia rettgeri]WHT95668.1 restriction endonuclease subunit S [Providencia rettgeri]WJM88199.1 restriction endonuclease subunit S [Providencia rettgeri]